MKNLLLTGNTHDMIEWDVQSVFSETKLDPKITLAEYEMDNTVGTYCDGLSYYQVELLNRIQGY